MNRRTLLAGAAALAAAPARAQSGRTRIVFWHAMNGALNDEVNRICANFNAAQSEAEIVPVYKGTYPETLTAAIAAWRRTQAEDATRQRRPDLWQAHTTPQARPIDSAPGAP